MAESLAQLRPGDGPIKVTLTSDDQGVIFTPRELDAVQAHFGRPFTVVTADEGSDDKLVVLAWLKLRREGVTLDLDAMTDVLIEIRGEPPDPTSGLRPTTSPPSATTGE